jgi:UDP-glucose-4-epimerase GalE
VKGNVLVVGGAGYIGSHTCKELSRHGFVPVTLDNLSTGRRWAVQWGPLVQADIQDEMGLDRTFSEYRPLAVLHFAACAYVGESVANPAKYYKNNVSGSVVLFDAMRRHECKRVIFSSSCATYGASGAAPISENTRQSPINPYGRSKYMVEQILEDYRQAYGIQHVLLRYFNAAGADEDGDTGEVHEDETHLIPLCIFAALGEKEYLPVYGSDYSTPDGTAIRDYVHVSDLACAHVKALEYLLEDKGSNFFNLGTGKGSSVQTVVEAVERVSGRKVPVRHLSRRPGDPPVLVADCSKAEQELGFSCRYKDIADVVASAWRWHSEHALRHCE